MLLVVADAPVDESVVVDAVGSTVFLANENPGYPSAQMLFRDGHFRLNRGVFRAVVARRKIDRI